ncbi:MAG: ATP-binding region ATPase domain protein, partial [Bacteroidota bacterium]|nr:ATP-binding region ATPase domain protein [Bacteroidota bacterium]
MTIQQERARLEEQLQTTPDLKDQAQIILQILEKYASIYNRNEEVYIERLLQISAGLKSEEYSAWANHYHANILKAAGNYKEALEKAEKAISLFIAVSNQKGIAYTYNIMGRIYFRQGDHSMALVRHFAALKMNEEAGDKLGMANSRSGVGIAYLHQRNFPEALSNFISSLRIREEIGDKRGIAAAYDDLGRAYVEQNNYTEALSNQLTALNIREEIGDKEGIANSLENVGMVYRRQTNYTEALSNFFACLKIREETSSNGQIKDKPGIAAAHNMIGVVYIIQGNYEGALSHIMSSLKINEEIGYTEGIGRSYHNIGKVYHGQGDHPKALSNALASLKILEDIGSNVGVCGANIFIGKIYTSLSNYVSAAQHLSRGLKKAEAIGSKILRMEALEALYELKKAEGKGIEALTYHEQFTAAEKELNNEESSKKISGLQFSYQIDKKEREILFERKKKEALQVAYDLLDKEKKEAEFQQKRAEQSERFKQMFLANMSHEIRTPLNAVVGMTNLLLSVPQSEKNLRYLNAIRHSSDSLLVVINDVLNLSKIEAGKLMLENIPFGLIQQVEILGEMFELRARENKIKFSVACARGIPETLSGDPNRINQVLINLLSNAFKFTHKGSIALSVTVAGQDQYRFSIADTGIGIASEKLEIIFEDFQQADSSTTRQYGGTGLGLTISKQLVELMGGKIEVKSKLGKGSEFSFVIALQPVEKADLTPPDAMFKTKDKDLAGLKILLAEDNEYNEIVAVQILKKLLSRPKISTARSGKEVLQKLKASDYDIIFMDLHMPEMDGYEATRQIRGTLTGTKKDTTIVALTASALKEDIDNCLKCGMDGYISKPFTPHQLLSEIYKHLNPNKMPETAALANKKATMVEQTNEIDPAFLEAITGGSSVETLEYIDIFLKFAPLQMQKIESALKTSNNKGLYQALHSLKPQLKIMGASTVLQQTEQLETKARKAKNIDDVINKSARKIYKGLAVALKEWEEV